MTTREKVTKGWWVEGILDDDPPRIGPDGLVHEPTPHQISRVYHAKSAADDYAALLRKNLKRYPGSVTIRTKTGYDDLAGLPDRDA